LEKKHFLGTGEIVVNFFKKMGHFYKSLLQYVNNKKHAGTRC